MIPEATPPKRPHDSSEFRAATILLARCLLLGANGIQGGTPMSQLSREDFIELGVSAPTNSLTDWAAKQLDATKGREARLQYRKEKIGRRESV